MGGSRKMSDTRIKYDEMLEGLKADVESFVSEAEAGKEGRGSKKSAMAARKLSVVISKKLKDFRSLSVANDKEK